VKRFVATTRARKFRLGGPRRNARGAVQIEFILSILTVLFLIFGMWEMIMIMHTMNVLSDAAKEGVRYAIVHGDRNSSGYQSSSADVTAVKDVVQGYAKLSLHNISLMSVDVCYIPESGTGCDGSNAAPNRVRVDVAYTFVPYTALNLRPTLHAAAEGRIVY
jgi:Flp pilus assembly protein TadG